ncbi:MAG: hypothetical protein KC503_45990 [Myxococcales bacterium]|nr:hypothetical protein [Myxococcales bacterium]
MSRTSARLFAANLTVAALLLAACGGDTVSRPPVTPDGPFGTQLGLTVNNIELPDCAEQLHDLHHFYKQGDGLLVVMTMGVG